MGINALFLYYITSLHHNIFIVVVLSLAIREKDNDNEVQIIPLASIFILGSPLFDSP